MQKISLFIILSSLLFCNSRNSTSDTKAIRGTYCDSIPNYKVCTDNNGGAAACAKKFSCTDRASALISVLAATPSNGTASCSQINNTGGNADIGFYDPISKGCQYSTLTPCGKNGTSFYNSISQECVSFFVAQDPQTCSPIANRVGLYDSLGRSCSYISTSDAARFGINLNPISPKSNTVVPANRAAMINAQECWVDGSSVAKSRVTSIADITNMNSDYVKSNCPPLTFNNPGPMVGLDAMYSYQGDPAASAQAGVACVFDTNTNLVYLFKDASRNVLSPLRSLSQYTQTCDPALIQLIGQPVNAQSTPANASSGFVLEDVYLSYCKTNESNKNYAIGICKTVFSTALNPSLEDSADFKSCVEQCSKAK